MRVGETANIGDSKLEFDGVVIGFAEAGNWLPPPIKFDALSRDVRDALLTAALARAPRDGAFRAALDPDYAPDSPITRALVERRRVFDAWLTRATREGAAASPPLAGLVGLGGGLTPEGDDFIGGAMIALRSFGATEIADALARAVETLDRGATTILSRAMLRAAGEGFGGAALHDMLAALAAGEASRAISLLDAIDNIGHTSGWDALAGALHAITLPLRGRVDHRLASARR